MLVLVAMLLFGIIEFGITYNDYIAIRQGTREGPRLAVVDDVNNAPSCKINGTTITPPTKPSTAFDATNAVVCKTKNRIGLDASKTKVKIVVAGTSVGANVTVYRELSPDVGHGSPRPVPQRTHARLDGRHAARATTGVRQLHGTGGVMLRWRRRADGERGAVLVLMVISMTVMLGVSALVVDLGHGMEKRRELENSADAAALGGAQDLPATATAEATAKSLAAKNAPDGTLNWTTCTDSTRLTVVSPDTPCITYDSSFTRIRVRIPQQTYKSFFASVLGINTISTNGSATSACRVHRLRVDRALRAVLRLQRRPGLPQGGAERPSHRHVRRSVERQLQPPRHHAVRQRDAQHARTLRERLPTVSA